VRRARALVSASRGVGDILRVTPLVRVCARLGYDVDLLIASDYPDVVRLLEPDPDVRRVFHVASPWRTSAASRVEGLAAEQYDVATFTFWSRELKPQVRAARTLEFPPAQWVAEGDPSCVRTLARQLGWTGPLPPPFAHPSGRRFDLDPGTVALHAGCKPDWPWKKWHGFDALAARLHSVAIVGSAADERVDGTYFNRPFAWPPSARSFVGVLDLPDTAALLSQCDALVANDSGLMHLGVAVGVPTLGVFGITSPMREAIDAPNMTVVTKGLPCEPACRRGRWGRRDCEYHLRCLRTLEAGDVMPLLLKAAPAVRAACAGPEVSAWTR
jgi:hypothetical protein